ncbi:hypothetical protein PGT21_030764 [Puccinia graminis f. sp. tritici]|uniref:Uncharacterized protein n=1 Tax=Puccinia graminis f. sp. tritici TaxID=56615 RepID=A0A5B0PZ64_PUCGR|nr:hypothetical protein PGT21_030764 [Puccinia graminis f. sp. tritici]KAA1109243.1 hypothetical protein PGTUg99_022604 [Puccinia graminis f. sp. tritici]
MADVRRGQKCTTFAASYGDALDAARFDWLGDASPNQTTKPSAGFDSKCQSTSIGLPPLVNARLVLVSILKNPRKFSL